jgi:hypothetical protein
VTGTTEVALVVAGVGLAGTVAAPFVNAWLQRRNARRAAHEPAVAAARVIQRELEVIHGEAEQAVEQGVDEIEFPTAAWDANHLAVAARLSPEEFLVLERYYNIVRHGSVAGVLTLYNVAHPSISWLAEGKRNQVKPRRIDTSLAPRNMELPCVCGHSFGHHDWRAVRRRVRLTKRHAKFKDVGLDCKVCDCERFRGVGRLHYA